MKITELRKRFSPKFAALIKKRIGDTAEFRRHKHAFIKWRETFNPEVISPFVAHYTAPLKVDRPDSARDLTTEFYHGPFTPPEAPSMLASPDPLIMELAPPPPGSVFRLEESPFRLPPGRHIIPIIHRRARTASETLVADAGEHPPTVEEQAVERVRMTMELMAQHGVEIPRDQWPEWLQPEPGL